ncbi:hypothetical protein EB73_03540 [Mycobacterium sp. SWH-M3]|nr:hypothetical protein EB73_03540 [Mycobacterium sp. SWH-M3]
MSVNHDSRDSYDRFFPQDPNTGEQPAADSWRDRQVGGRDNGGSTGPQPVAAPDPRRQNAPQQQDWNTTGHRPQQWGADPRQQQSADQQQRPAWPQPVRNAPPQHEQPQPPGDDERTYAHIPIPKPELPEPPLAEPASGANNREHFFNAAPDEEQRAWPATGSAPHPSFANPYTSPLQSPHTSPVQSMPGAHAQPEHRTQQSPAASSAPSTIQVTQNIPEWMAEPADRSYVDSRVGDDEESLTYSADRLDLIGSRKLPPGRGWRKWLYTLTFHKLNLGLSPKEVAYAEMVTTIRQPITGDYKIGVLSLKGGVGKTTTTVALGSTFAQLRKGDRVVALDGNPDFGNLVSRVAKQTNTTVKDLLSDKNLARYGDVRKHTSQNDHGLEVVAGERDLNQSEQFSKEEFERVMAVLERHYTLIFTDCGTGVINEAMAGVLETAHALIMVCSTTVDGARAVSANIEWLRRHGHHHLVERAVVVLNTNKQGKSSANIDQLREHFGPWVRAVHAIPFDDHLAEGAEVHLALLNKETRRAFEELAEIIATDFPSAADNQAHQADQADD